MEHYIPRYLDEPERILFLTLVEALVGFGMNYAWIALNQFLPGLLLGITALYFYRRFKGTHSSHVLRYQAYWYLPPGLAGTRATPPAHLRIFLG